jgi:hypothetical protein
MFKGLLIRVVFIGVHTDQYRYTRRDLFRTVDAVATATEEYQSGAPVYTYLEIQYITHSAESSVRCVFCPAPLGH